MYCRSVWCEVFAADVWITRACEITAVFSHYQTFLGKFTCCCSFCPLFAPVWVRDFPSWFTLDKLIRPPQRDAYGNITYFAILALYCLVLLNSFPGTCTRGNWYWYHTLITRRFLAKLPLARWSGGFLQS